MWDGHGYGVRMCTQYWLGSPRDCLVIRNNITNAVPAPPSLHNGRQYETSPLVSVKGTRLHFLPGGRVKASMWPRIQCHLFFTVPRIGWTWWMCVFVRPSPFGRLCVDLRWCAWAPLYSVLLTASIDRPPFSVSAFFLFIRSRLFYWFLIV